MISTTARQNQQNTSVSVRVLSGFTDAHFGEQEWMDLLGKGYTNTVNLTWHWQQSWWKAFGRGRLLLILAEKNGIPVALAPLFTIEGMVYNLCPEDCLDFVGNISDPAVLDAILTTAMREAEQFAGFIFYFVPEISPTGIYLQDAALRLGLSAQKADHMPSPFLDIKADPEKAFEMTRKKSLRRHENYFLRNGEVEVLHLQTAEDIAPHLDAFFRQHTERRAITAAPSIFLKSEQRDYYRQLTKDIGQTGWLRLTRINWNGSPIAFHFGLSYNGRYLLGIPSFEVGLAEHSPGEVLLRQVMLAAITEGASSFDFGIGDEAYKYRFADGVTHLYNWELYPANS